jgi:hypothetical protein
MEETEEATTSGGGSNGGGDTGGASAAGGGEGVEGGSDLEDLEDGGDAHSDLGGQTGDERAVDQMDLWSSLSILYVSLSICIPRGIWNKLKKLGLGFTNWGFLPCFFFVWILKFGKSEFINFSCMDNLERNLGHDDITYLNIDKMELADKKKNELLLRFDSSEVLKLNVKRGGDGVAKQVKLNKVAQWVRMHHVLLCMPIQLCMISVLLL